MGSHFSKPKSLQDQLAEMKRSSSASNVDATGGPAGAKGWLCLGKKLHGDLMPAQLGLRYHEGWLYLAEDLLDQHLFLLGATGAGLMAKLLAGLEATGGQIGLQVMCIGHGMSTATIVERI